MSTDFRALCQELADALAEQDRCWMLINDARAALAQPEPVGEAPTDEELLRVAASAIDPYESSGIAIGEYEPETECAIEVYGSELIAYARAVLAKWGTPANNTRDHH
jgi:hypothetical protein